MLQYWWKFSLQTQFFFHSQRNHRILKSFFMFHAAMTVSIFFGGLFFSLSYSVPHAKDHHLHAADGGHHEHHHNNKVDRHVMHDGQNEVTPHAIDGDKKEANLELLALTTVDFFIRSYMCMCVYSLLVKFKSESIETDFMNGSDKQRLSYGSGTGSMDKMTDNCSVINER